MSAPSVETTGLHDRRACKSDRNFKAIGKLFGKVQDHFRTLVWLKMGSVRHFLNRMLAAVANAGESQARGDTGKAGAREVRTSIP